LYIYVFLLNKVIFCDKPGTENHVEYEQYSNIRLCKYCINICCCVLTSSPFVPDGPFAPIGPADPYQKKKKKKRQRRERKEIKRGKIKERKERMKEKRRKKGKWKQIRKKEGNKEQKLLVC